MKKNYLLFDLDGTLTDPMEGITRAVQCALKHYGIWEPDRRKLCPFIGPPLKQGFMKYYGFEAKKAEEAVEVYREYYKRQGIFENFVYPGIPEMLEALKSGGQKILLATSKPEVFARQILEHFDLDRYFDFIGGADMGEARAQKGDVIRYVLEENGIADVSQAVMAGGSGVRYPGSRRKRHRFRWSPVWLWEPPGTGDGRGESPGRDGREPGASPGRRMGGRLC